MKSAHLVLRAAASLYAPLIALFAFSLLASRPAGVGVGFAAGVGMILVLALHMIVYGAAAARAAFPSTLARAMFSIGLILTLIGVGAPALRYASQLAEAGLFIGVSCGGGLILTMLVGRAPSLRDEEW